MYNRIRCILDDNSNPALVEMFARSLTKLNKRKGRKSDWQGITVVTKQGAHHAVFSFSPSCSVHRPQVGWHHHMVLS